MNKQDMIVMVTGAAGGTGQAITMGFLKAGAKVYALDIHRPSWECRREYELRLERIAISVTDEDGIAALVHGKGINVLVNNAGIAYECPLQELELATWHRIMDVNAMGTLLCTREVVRGLLSNKQEGRIINISSIAGKNAFGNNAAYAASKAAIIGLTRSLAVELAPRGINVNAICPGSVDTEMLDRVIQGIAKDCGGDPMVIRESIQNNIPTRRFQKPEEVAALCVFLASEEASSINGEAINLDGGVVRD